MNQTHRPCIVCGRPANPHPEHHAVEKGDGSTGPKGMGGSSKNHEDERVVTCRTCHGDLHEGTTMLRRDRGFFVITRNGVVSRRAQDEIDYAYDGNTEELIDVLRFMTDASLIAVVAAGMERGAEAALGICVALAELRQRYASFGDGFAARAADMVRDAEGVAISVGSVYNWTNIGVAALAFKGDRVAAFQMLGRSVLSAAGHAITNGIEPSRIIDFVEAARDRGERMTVVAREVKAMEGKPKAKPPRCTVDSPHTCKWCGDEWEDA